MTVELVLVVGAFFVISGAVVWLLWWSANRTELRGYGTDSTFILENVSERRVDLSKTGGWAP